MSKKQFRNMIAYEIYPTSFFDSNNDGIGDLKGITLKLDYIKQLGFNAIWLNPFYSSPFKDGGYDVEDFFKVDKRFGTLNDFKKLVSKAHSNEIKIIIDLVAGHASLANKDFLKSAEAKRNDKSDLFIWSDNPWEKSENLISGMYDRHGCYMVNFFAHQPAFNYGFNRIDHPFWQMSYKDKRTYQAREYLLSIMRFWLEAGCDGFRVDMADSLVKNDEGHQATIEVWNYLFKKIRKEFPDAFFVSEWSYPAQSFAAGFDADFVLDHWDNFYHRFFRSDKDTRGVSIINGNNDVEFSINDLKERFAQAEKHKSYLALISGNHDTWRIANYLNFEQLKMFYMFLFCMPGIPFVLYGDELMMKTADLPSKDGGYQRTGTRIPMIWNDRKPNHGFTTSSKPYLPFNPENRISVESSIKDENSLYHFIRRLIELRKSLSDLSVPPVDIKEEKRVFIFSRGKHKLIMNMSAKPYRFKGKVIFATSSLKDELLPGQAALIR